MCKSVSKLYIILFNTVTVFIVVFFVCIVFIVLYRIVTWHKNFLWDK